MDMKKQHGFLGAVPVQRLLSGDRGLALVLITRLESCASESIFVVLTEDSRDELQARAQER